MNKQGPIIKKKRDFGKNRKQLNLKIDKNLTHGSDYSQANSIFVMGSDIYIAGTESGLATYWKNRYLVNLVRQTKNRPG
jgi:hypothetical protein